MDQESLLFESITTIKQDLLAMPYVRHYMQEQSLTFNGNENQKVELPFNHLINQIVGQLSIVNKQIAANSKLTSSLLENGRDIYSKKRQHFDDFKKQYAMIGDSLKAMPHHYRLVFQYSVMALANLILKLSINMAKISIIVVTKILTPPYLNLFTVAILFEKYLELQLVTNKKFDTLEDHRHYLKQFPKITVLKISKKHNPYDIDFIRRSQSTFNFTPLGVKQTKHEVRNIQFIEFFEEEGDSFYKPKQSQKYSQHDISFNLASFGLKAPFSFELYLLISEIVVPKMSDFKPDIIIYIEDFDTDSVFIDPKVRGLIVNQLSEKVQQKIYVFKEFGVTQSMKTSWLQEHYQQQLPQFQYKFAKKVSQIVDKTTAPSNIKNVRFIEECDKNHHHQQRRTSIEEYMGQLMNITHDVFKQLSNHFKIEYRKNTIFAMNSNSKTNAFAQKIKTMHGNMLTDLTYLSLALIQKSNFEQSIKQYNSFIFDPLFLQKVMEWISRELHLIQNKKTLFQCSELYKNKIKKIKGMQVLSLASPQLQQKQLTFYNFLNCREQQLQYFQGKSPLPISISKEDSFYVAYVQNFVILFVFAESFYWIFRKNKKDQFFKKIKNGNLTNENPNLFKKHSTLVANNKYFYKAFGESKNEQLNNESQIFRINIEKPLELQWSKWEKLGSQCIPSLSTDKSVLKKSTQTIPIQFKRHGFGYSYDTVQQQKQVNIVLFGGGFNFKIQNEQKVNRYFYIIKDNSNDIYKIGKTNNDLVEQNSNMRNRTIIYPFIYGVPVLHTQGELTVINTNGYLQNVNHFKKMFLTKVRTGPINALSSIGIIGQNKLDYTRQSSQIAVANKNTILSYIMHSYYRINRYRNQVALYSPQNKIFVLQSSRETQKQHYDVVRVTPLNYQQMSENLDTLSVSFGSKKMILKI